MGYIKKIWSARFFWRHLVSSDLRSKWRRSALGVLWGVIQPLGLTLLIAFVFGRVFGADIRTYAPYILSGIIVWEFITASISAGSMAFIQADQYIKQCNHPLAIYSLRTVLLNSYVMIVASMSLFLWIVIEFPQNFGLTWLSLLVVPIIYLVMLWPMATILAYAGTRFRDLQHVLGIVLQAIWFMSPVYLEERLFRSANLAPLLDHNPIYHMLELVRAPLLRGSFPTLTNYAYCLGFFIVALLLSILIGRRVERKIIFYL